MKIQTNCEIRYITPEEASEWLSDQWKEQRNIRPAHVEHLLRDMRAGDYRLSPDAILRIKGKLANGQHRLTAVVQFGKPVNFLVMESNDNELYKVIDAGIKRSVSDVFIGNEYSSSTPAIARLILAYEAKTVSKAQLVSRTNLIAYCNENMKSLTEAAAFAYNLYNKSHMLPISIGGAMYSIASNLDLVEQVKPFLRIVYGEGDSKNAGGDLRQRLIKDKGAKAKLPASYVFAIALKAFNGFLGGRRAQPLKWQKDEEFPTVCL